MKVCEKKVEIELNNVALVEPHRLEVQRQQKKDNQWTKL